VDLDAEAGSRRGRDTFKPVGKWVKPTCEGATGKKREDLQGTPLGREW